jgi:hypothetical protein
MEATAIQTVSRAMLFPAQALISAIGVTIKEHSREKLDSPASKAKDATISRIRQVIVNETLGLENFRFYEDSLVM